jgi:hypothetical protein
MQIKMGQPWRHSVLFLESMTQLIDRNSKVEFPSSPIWFEMIKLREEMRGYFNFSKDEKSEESVSLLSSDKVELTVTIGRP